MQLVYFDRLLITYIFLKTDNDKIEHTILTSPDVFEPIFLVADVILFRGDFVQDFAFNINAFFWQTATWKSRLLFLLVVKNMERGAILQEQLRLHIIFYNIETTEATNFNYAQNYTTIVAIW